MGTRARRMRHQGLRMALVLAAVLPWLACTTAVNPATGRREVVLMTPEDEQRIGDQARREIQSSLGLVRDEELVAYVQEIGDRLAQFSPRRDVQYTFSIVELDEPNAFALPGGHIFVSRGLMVLANSEAELAHVIGHEIAHVAAKHSANRDAHAKTFGIATLISDMLSGGGEPIHESETAGANPIARYARNQERQADLIGQEIATRANVEPTGMARFLTALDNYTKLSQGFSMPQTYFATHPALRERMAEAATRAQTEAWRQRGDAPPGLQSQQRSLEEDRDIYLDRIEGMAVERPASEGVFVDDRFLHADLDFTLRFPHGWTTRNEASWVGAFAPKRDGVVALELQGPGNDPAQAAADYATREGLKLQGATPVKIGELNGFRAVSVMPTAFGPLKAEITWIAHNDLVYRLIGGMQSGQLRKYQGLFRKFAQSFRPLSREESGSVAELRLRTALALPGETLPELSERTGNEWDLTFTSVANGIFTHEPLAPGQRVKIAVREPYVPDAAAPSE